ncbi:sulfatase [Echinicola sp. 20G]|uniref:sulfatase family protein n=1 Tax=Echinicola sp. 20G TaxID=2781961 RepID=UPI00191027DA|nr:sulfatase [Echinicola sp. 20G]
MGQTKDLPNIIWLTSEDNSPFAGCYGDQFATTPNMDHLASEGFLYTHAYANAPVCAPARNTIITGVYANSGGNQHMRSHYPKSDIIQLLPELLRKAGYYCTNNSKEDYNMDPEQAADIWDESSRKAHYKNRPAGKPFFAVFNNTISHESSIHKSIPNKSLRHDPAKVKLPPYHPDTPEMRHDWAQYYDKIEDMDTWLGEKLQELEDEGLLENTIVFYFGDHGGVLGRSKRFVYESGTRIPMIVRIPQKYKSIFPALNAGDKVDRMVSFVDLAPTLMSIIGEDIPNWMQGHAFLGEQKTADPRQVFMFRGRMDERYDMSRAIRTPRYRYIINYMPHRIYGQHINYLWKAPSMVSWEQAYLNGQCNDYQSAFWEPKPFEELYDTESDPWEVNNLAADPAYADILDSLRKETRNWSLQIKDTGFIPETERNILYPNGSLYDYMQTLPSETLEFWVDVANMAAAGQVKNLQKLFELLDNQDPVVRYWAATGILILGDKAKPFAQKIMDKMSDQSPAVTPVISEYLYSNGQQNEGLKYLKQCIGSPELFSRVQALNVVDIQDINQKEVQQSLENMLLLYPDNDAPDRYDLRLVQWLKDKWSK